jgi:DNA invertase Pin-like site-specific DNA recombinase
MAKEHVRCAIYTRKSSEEGLEQSFNSLEAQREACCAFILSQKHEGWIPLATRYDDGGFSGGSMERPALQELLSDIQAGKLDTVVVYKVDRLTRALTDFAKIIEIFDSHSVSFVSVTQQFNTTTSMGRLTLNVLLSFAQFEREITGERIRDKIAASKKKGMWMGGVVPLGYECVDHRLIVNEAEAETVRKIFTQYVKLGSVRKLKKFLDQSDLRSKARTSAAGRKSGEATFFRGALYHLLKNRIYIGEIRHRSQCYPGQHQSIVPRKLWDQVAALLESNNQAHRTGASVSTPSLLSGKLFDSNGARFTPTHAARGAKRYRYYTSQNIIRQEGAQPAITRFPAQDLENFVLGQIHLLLQAPDKFTAEMTGSPSKEAVTERANELAKKWPKLEISKQHEFTKNILKRVVVGKAAVWIEIDRPKLLTALLGQNSESLSPSSGRKHEILKLSGDFQALHRGGKLSVIGPQNGSSFEGAPVPSLVKAIARARDWYDRIAAGEIETMDQLSQESGLPRRYVRRILRCASLSPSITETLLVGKHRPSLTLNEILQGVPLDWGAQKKTSLQLL